MKEEPMTAEQAWEQYDNRNAIRIECIEELHRAEEAHAAADRDRRAALAAAIAIGPRPVKVPS